VTTCDTCWDLVETCNSCWYKYGPGWWQWWYGANCDKCGSSYEWYSYDCNCTSQTITTCNSCWGPPVQINNCAVCGSTIQTYTYDCNCTYEEKCKTCWGIANIFQQTDCEKCGSYEETFTIKECQTKYKTETITSCEHGDDCCPATCNWFSDNDCPSCLATNKPATYYSEEGKCYYGCTNDCTNAGWFRSGCSSLTIDDDNPCTSDSCTPEGAKHYKVAEGTSCLTIAGELGKCLRGACLKPAEVKEPLPAPKIKFEVSCTPFPFIFGEIKCEKAITIAKSQFLGEVYRLLKIEKAIDKETGYPIWIVTVETKNNIIESHIHRITGKIISTDIYPWGGEKF
jgi:hypothetical protein